jgi:hypothetical protein
MCISKVYFDVKTGSDIGISNWYLLSVSISAYRKYNLSKTKSTGVVCISKIYFDLKPGSDIGISNWFILICLFFQLT